MRYLLYGNTSSNISTEECGYVNHYTNFTEKCLFVQNNTECQDTDGYINYVETLYCTFEGKQWEGIILYVLWLLVLFVGLATAADDFLVPNLETISKMLRLSPNIAGVTILAFGNGAPDIFSSIAGISNARPELVIGELFGAGVFVTTAVAGAVCWVSPFHVMERPFLRDLTFYICAGFWAFMIFYRGYITIYDSAGFLGLYVFYILVVVIGRIINQRIRKKNASNIDQQPILDDENVGDEDERRTTDNCTLAAQENTRNSPTKSQGQESISVITINPNSLKVEETSANQINQQNNFPEEVQEYEQILTSLQSRTSPVGDNVEDNHDDARSNSSGSNSTEMSDGMNKWAWTQLAEKLNPFNDFKELSMVMKVWAIIKSPVLFLFTITTPVVNEEEENYGWCQYLLVIQCIIGCQFVCFCTNLSSIVIYESISFWQLGLVLSLLVSIVILCTSIPSKNPKYFRWAVSLLGFAISIVWMYVIPNEIVGLLKAFGVTLNLSDAVLGLTVLAWGNSIGDFVADTATAKQGYPRMGFSACFGGPLLNLLLGIGISFTIEFFKKGLDHHIKVQYDSMVLTLACSLGIALLTSFIMFPLTKFKASKYHGMGLMGLYFALLSAALIVEFTAIE